MAAMAVLLHFWFPQNSITFPLYIKTNISEKFDWNVSKKNKCYQKDSWTMQNWPYKN